jgi:hypothetical protein
MPSETVSAALTQLVEVCRTVVMWQPRTRRWTRHTDNVTGTSDVSSKNGTTRQSDNSDHTKRQFELVTRLGRSRSATHAERASFFVCSAVTGTQRGQCTSSNELLMMWGRYPVIARPETKRRVLSRFLILSQRLRAVT